MAKNRSYGLFSFRGVSRFKFLMEFDKVKSNAAGVDGFLFIFLKLIWPRYDAHILYITKNVLVLLLSGKLASHLTLECLADFNLASSLEDL